MENILLTVLQLSLFETLCVTGSLILIGFILGFIENRANFYIQSVFGMKGIMATAWIGTPIHESGHLLMCYIFKHKVNEFKLFNLRPRDGVLGYVNHSWNQKSLYQNIGNFFIGMGPIFSGTFTLILGMYMFLPDSFATFSNYLTLGSGQLDSQTLSSIFMLTAQLFKSIFSAENLVSPSFWIYFALAIGISSHIALSKEDLKGAGRGLITIFTFILLVNVIALILNADFSSFFTGILTLNVYLLAFSMVSIVFSLIRLVLGAFAYTLVSRII
jgi:tryptophan-rich sensory protein